MTTDALQPMSPEELTRIPTDDEGGFGALETARGALPLAAMDIAARLVGLTASIDLRQTFVNNLDCPLEATYIFPLPERAAVSRFRMEVNGRVTEGVIQERGQARREYDQAIATGHRASIAEEERAGVFTLRLGNLLPGERAAISLSLTGPLSVDDGEATFRFPLVVAPRYIPGTPLEGDSVGDGVALDTDAVPDASRITPPVLLPGYPNPIRLGIRVDLDGAGLPIANLRSSLHAVTQSGEAPRRIRIELQPGERLNRDFILRYTIGDDAVRTSLITYPDPEGEPAAESGGTFLLTLVPPAGAAGETRPRDVAFVLDRSGSMGGWKMVAARRAVARMVDTLTERDRFAVYAFDNTIETPPNQPERDLLAATDRNRFRAVEFLAGVDARGGTEMAEPLERAAAQLAGGYDERDRVLVLITDGQVGNEDQILRGLGAQLGNVRTFSVGIDTAVNAAFLTRLAALGGGYTEIVESEDRLDEAMDRIHRRIATPVVTELRIEPDAALGVDPTSIAPARLPDLMVGTPVVIAGRYRGAGVGRIAIAGRDEVGGTWQERATARVGAADRAASALWARAQVRALEDRYALGYGNRDDLRARIVDTSLRFSVLCRFTAFLAVDRSDVANPGGERARVLQPVEAPADWASLQAVPAAAPMPVAMTPMAAQHLAADGKVEKARLMAGPSGAFGGAAPPPAAGARSRSAGRAIASAVAAPLRALRHLPLGRSTGEGDGNEMAAMAPVSLDAYWQRLRDLANPARAAAEAKLRAALGRLAASLEILADDLRSIGAPAHVANALRGIVEQLRADLADPAARLEASRARTLEAIEALLRGETPTRSPDRRAEFWK